MALWGPYRISTLNGCYFLTIVDDYTRTTWTHLLSTKQHIIQVLQHFLAYAINQFGHSVKIIRSDNGREFFNHILHTHFANKGIIHQSSCSQTPQQNGLVERKHKHLLEVTRALKFQSGVPVSFWVHCLLTATYIINRLPSSVLNNKTPHKMRFHKPPSYSHLKTFGCLCFASVHTTDKLAPRAIKSVFLGYPLTQKGYKLLNLDTLQVFVSRHVVFHEDNFSFH